jgi:outer membrane lipoprotein-sorting protein
MIFYYGVQMIKLFLLSFLIFRISAYAQDAEEIVRKADENMRAKSSYVELTMTIQKPTWSRTLEMKAWALEPDFSMIYVSSPARDKGSVTLKRKNEVWNWIPSAQKVIKIPPSMMLQSWMGSDFTNDDLVREASYVRDYTHKLLGEEKVNGYSAYKIESVPKPGKGIVWGKVISWIGTKDYLNLRGEYYDEDGELIKIFTGSNEKKFGSRNIMSRWEMSPVDKPGNKTIMEYSEMKFNIDVKESFFSEQNMKKVR